MHYVQSKVNYMPQLSKAEKTAVKKVKAQASAKVEVKGMGGYPVNATIKATGKQPRAGHNQDWVDDDYSDYEPRYVEESL